MFSGQFLCENSGITFSTYKSFRCFLQILCGDDNQVENTKLKFRGHVQSGDVHLDGLKIDIFY